MARKHQLPEDSGAAGEDDPTVRPSRRQYLKFGMAAAAMATTGTIAAATADEVQRRYDIQFDRVLDAVDDLGMDPTGSVPIDDALANAYDTGTLLLFPPGDYTVATEAPMGHRASESRFGLVGLGDSHRDVQFHFPNYDGTTGYFFIHQRGGKDCVLANFSLQLTDDETTNADVWFAPNDGGLIEDVEWLGFIPDDHYSRGQVLVCGPNADNGATHDGVNVVRRVTMGKGGSSLAAHPMGSTGIRFYPGFVGETILEDCHIEQLGGNGVRSSAGDGVVTVRGGLYKNNQLTSLRFQGGEHPTKVSSITGARIVVDQLNPDRPTHGGDFHNANAIIVESRNGASGLVIEDTDIICRSISPDAARNDVIQLNAVGQSNPGGFTMRNCRIVNETSLTTVHVYPAKDGAQPPRGVTFEHVAITALDADQQAGAVVVIEADRDGSSIANSCIYAPNGDIDGVRVVDANDCEIVDSTINVSGDATVADGASLAVSNLAQSGTCPLPGEAVDLEPAEPEPDGRHLRIVADQDADAFSYAFTVDGDVTLLTEGDYPANPVDDGGADEAVDNGDGTTTVTGVVAGFDGDSTQFGGDSFRIYGDVLAFSKDGPGTVYLEHQAIDPLDLVVDADEPESPTEHLLRIVADDDADAFEYTFTVDGPIAFETEGDYPANPTEDGGADAITDNGDGTFTATGVVAGYTGDSTSFGGDTYRIAGDLLAFDLGGPATVTLDGTVLDLAEYFAEGSRYLHVTADRYIESAEYAFSVAGDVDLIDRRFLLENDRAHDGTESIDTSDGTVRVEGGLAGAERHTYAIEGAIVGMDVDDAVTVTIDESFVDPDEYGLSERLAIIGTGSSSSYHFTVDGDLMADPNGSVDREGDISGQSAEGAVTNGIAAYRFDGDIVDFSLLGTAGVYLNGQQVDPTLLDGMAEADPTLPNELLVEGTGTETTYEFEVSGAVYKSPDLGPVDADDRIDEGTVTGRINEGADGYRFTGDLVSLVVSGSATVSLNH